MAEPLVQLNQVIPNVAGATTPVNNLGTTGLQVIAADQSRQKITFHNPNVAGQVNVMIYQMGTAAGGTNAPTFAAPGGGYVILPGDTVTFTGDVQCAWGALAQSGASNGLTVISSRS